MRVLLVGDTHGNEQFLRYACEAANQYGCDLLLQLGDWSYIWPEYDDVSMTEHYGVPHRNRTKQLLSPSIKLGRIDKILTDNDMKMVFIDGNHEHFKTWKEMGIFTDSRKAISVTPNCSYSPRGYCWEWDGVKFMSLGGAVSVDRAMRKEGVSYFKDEEITDSDVDRCLEAGSIDVLLSHDTVQIPARLESHLQINGFRLSSAIRRDCLLNTNKVTKVVRELKPSHMYHGHYHFSYADVWEGVHVRGLSCDGTGMSALHVFDTELYHKGLQT